jgi:tryptophan 2-C-methyltransferase
LPPEILLVNPNQIKPVVTPVALDYLAQSLEKNGFHSEILDLAFADDPASKIKQRLDDRNFLLIGITVRNIDDSYFASQDFCLQRTKTIIDQIRSETATPIVLGGVGFSIMPEFTLRYCEVDMGIKGDGEWSLPLLAERLVTDRDLAKVPGLIYKEEGKYRHNPAQSCSPASISLSRREAIDNLRYLQEGGMVGFETKRGCNQKCTYCADPLSKGKRIRFRNPKDVASELAFLYDKGIDHFHTCDSEFNIPERHAIEVCQEIVNRHLGDKIRWYAYASPAPFSEELARWMKKAGCVGIDFGVDHGNDRMLGSLGRAHQVENIKKTASLAKEYAFAFMFDLLLGGPGETRDTIQQTMALMKKLDPDRVGISLGIRLYKGTLLARKVTKEGEWGIGNKNLHGIIDRNKSMFQPVFYLASELGDDIEDSIGKEIAGDSRFLIGNRKNMERNYNYNDNSLLMEAIKKGARGAFWDILRKIGN